MCDIYFIFVICYYIHCLLSDLIKLERYLHLVYIILVAKYNLFFIFFLPIYFGCFTVTFLWDLFFTFALACADFLNASYQEDKNKGRQNPITYSIYISLYELISFLFDFSGINN